MRYNLTRAGSYAPVTRFRSLLRPAPSPTTTSPRPDTKMDSSPIRLPPSDQDEMELDPPQNTGTIDGAGETMSDGPATRDRSLAEHLPRHVVQRDSPESGASIVFTVEECSSQKSIGNDYPHRTESIWRC